MIFTGSLTLFFLKNLFKIFIKLNNFFLCSYLNFYFHYLNIILMNHSNDLITIFEFKKNILNLNFFKNSFRNFSNSYNIILYQSLI